MRRFVVRDAAAGRAARRPGAVVRLSQACRRRRAAWLSAIAATVLVLPAAADDRQAAAAQARAGSTAALPGVRESIVFDAARLQGHPMQASALRSSEPAALAIDRIDRQWRATPGTPVVRSRTGAWLIASRLTDRGIETVQLRDAGEGSEGFRTRWGRRTSAASLPDWLPAGAGSVQRIESKDGSRGGITTIAALPGSVPAMHRALLEALGARGWKTDDTARLQPAVRAAERAGQALALMRRGYEEMLISIGPAPGGAALIAHQTESP